MRRLFQFLPIYLLLSLCVPAVAWSAEGCVINRVNGSATIHRDGASMDAKDKDSLKKGDCVETGPQCTMDMSMNDLAGCRLLPATKMTVAGWKTESMSLILENGNVVLNLAKLPEKSSFRVETPTAVATVRGTQFWGRVNPGENDANVTTFAVRQGSIEISPNNTDKTYLLSPGEALDIPSGSSGATRRAALPEEMQAMEQADAIPMAAA